MFKSLTFRSFVVALLSWTLSACATYAGLSPAPTESANLIAASHTTFNPMPVEVRHAELNAPELQVPELTVEELPVLKTLSDRARVRLSDAEMKCVADAVYFEASGEGPVGMTAVGYVVLNRMGHSYFPSTACGVVHQKTRRSCEFSWTCDRKPDRIRNKATYAMAQEIARGVMTRQLRNPVGDSIFFRHRSIGRTAHRYERFYAAVGQHRFFLALR